MVEDSTDLQRMLRAMLHEIPQVEVIASVTNESAALNVIRTGGTDLAIVDLELETGTGLGFLKSLFENLGAEFNPVKVVIFSNYSNLVIQHRCLSLGAKAFFDKSFQIDELLEFVQAEASLKTGSLATKPIKPI